VTVKVHLDGAEGGVEGCNCGVNRHALIVSYRGEQLVSHYSGHFHVEQWQDGSIVLPSLEGSHGFVT
jgi:hypothetical protein